VLYKSDNTAFSNTDLSTATDVTAHFTLDSGQRDNSYEYSQLVAKTSASSIVRPTGRLLVIFDWFEHQGRGYATVDSYLSSANVLKGMTYDIIPDYKSPKFNNTLNLRDVLTSVLCAQRQFAATALQTCSQRCGREHNLPHVNDSGIVLDSCLGRRVDWKLPVLPLTLRQNWTVLRWNVQGHRRTDAVQPVPPSKEDGSLLLFQLKVPPYTLVNANGVPTTVALKTFDHKRYTMRDLSKIDERVSHLNTTRRSTRWNKSRQAEHHGRRRTRTLQERYPCRFVPWCDCRGHHKADFTASLSIR
jgi:hypothetical protein